MFFSFHIKKDHPPPLFFSSCSYEHLFIVFPSCFSGASNMETFLVLVGLDKVRDGMPQLAGTVLLLTGTGVHAFVFCIYLCSSSEALVCFLLVITGYADVQ